MKRISQQESSSTMHHKFEEIKHRFNHIKRRRANFSSIDFQKITKESSVKEVSSSFLRQFSPNIKSERLMTLVILTEQEKDALQEKVKKISIKRDLFKFKLDDLKKELQTKSSIIEELKRENERLKQETGKSSLSSCLKNKYSTPKKHRVSFPKNPATVIRFNYDNIEEEIQNQALEIQQQPLFIRPLKFSEYIDIDFKKHNKNHL